MLNVTMEKSETYYSVYLIFMAGSELEYQLKGSRALVVGLGVSGFWTALWLSNIGAHVTVSDVKPEIHMDQKKLNKLKDLGVIIEAGRHNEQTFIQSDIIILSPGVPHDMELVSKAQERGAKVMGELELGSRLIKEPIIAVTGTNGKTTAVTLLGQIIKNSGRKVFVGGNIGSPLMEYVARGEKADYVVAEVSSFQLDTAETFSPHVSILLNIAPDHLDRYPNYGAYINSKFKIFENQGSGQYAIINDSDEVISRSISISGPEVLRYGLTPHMQRHAHIQNNSAVAKTPSGIAYRFSLENFSLPGNHNRENLLAVILAALCVGIDKEAIQQTIDNFKGLPHRLEHVATAKGVKFYNDSKATNVDSVVKAIQSFTEPIILIAGGLHKGASYDPIAVVGKGRIKHAILIGEAKEIIAKDIGGTIPLQMASDMDDAVSKAIAIANLGDVVLLSPACASFDMFSNYKERGDAFKRAVKEIIHG